MSFPPLGSDSQGHSTLFKQPEQANSIPTSQGQFAMPKVGQTRCYWSLLSSELDFIYLDPVLAYHLEEQADVLVGRSLLDFVHPDERTSARTDLGNVLKAKTLHGSVTRVRFSRLSQVRRLLGYTNYSSPWKDADKIAIDSCYMAVDIVINWAAEGLVLCFIHAIVDLNPKSDNDEKHKTEWTNWCGTVPMSNEQITLLYNRLLMCIPQTTNMQRVFQILANQPERSLLLSWPPDSNQGPAGRDFARLVGNVLIASGQAGDSTGAKTSCTRRYKATANMPMAGEVESIYIPHGSVIFACHHVDPRTLPYADVYGNTPAPPYSNTASASPHESMQQAWAATNDPRYPHGWDVPPQDDYHSQKQWPAPPPPSYPQYTPPATPSHHTYDSSQGGTGLDPASADVVPPSRRRVSSGSAQQTKESGRANGNRPAGITKCSSCGATSSPEWRKGPSGKKELCNACGLRYARSRAKKDGQSLAQRKKKEKSVLQAAIHATRRESVTPPVTPGTSISSNGGRRNAEGGAYTPSPTDVYPPQRLDELPSPSTSSATYAYPGMGDNRHHPPPPFVQLHPHYYSGPSPLSNPPIHGSDLPTSTSYERDSRIREGR